MFSIVFAYFLASILQHGTGKIVDYSYPRKYAPSYLKEFAPPLEENGFRLIPINYSNNKPYLWGMNVGTDEISFTYGDTEGYDVWDPNESEIPLYIYFSRQRFGWPKRVLSYDAFSTGISISDRDAQAYYKPAVQAYHRKVSKKAGVHQGLDRPAWLPSFISLNTVPVAVNWTGLFANTIFWGICWLIPGAIWRTVRTYRRRRRGLCLACGYVVEDLEVCPECGSDHAACSPG